MTNFRVTLFLIALIFLYICIDYFFKYLGIPIVTMDLIFACTSIFIIYFSLNPRLKSSDFVADKVIYYSAERLSLSLLFAFIFLIISAILIYIGLQNPLSLLDGYRGKIHLYSLSIFGLAISIFLLRFIYLVLSKRQKVKQ
ncbi:MAG: hypothetical protein HWE24_10570 [Oceanospirillaceae bacterium]|nr:hypothetical protein [Oceanospirillaceae bacterium]